MGLFQGCPFALIEQGCVWGFSAMNNRNVLFLACFCTALIHFLTRLQECFCSSLQCHQLHQLRRLHQGASYRLFGRQTLLSQAAPTHKRRQQKSFAAANCFYTAFIHLLAKQVVNAVRELLFSFWQFNFSLWVRFFTCFLLP